MGDTVGLVASHHLVTDLDKVPGIEERIVCEQRVADGLGVGVERVIASKRRGLVALA